LARIDPRDFKVALHQAQSDVAAAYATIADKQAALQVQQTVIAGARATVAVDQATERFAEQDNQRYATLAKDGWGTVQKAQEAASRIAAAHAAVARDAAALANAARQVDVSRPIDVVVLKCWVMETNETPRASKISTSLAKSASERVSRSTL
jgi:membrane fusion protein (multidrug efflux system)